MITQNAVNLTFNHVTIYSHNNETFGIHQRIEFTDFRFKMLRNCSHFVNFLKVLETPELGSSNHRVANHKFNCHISTFYVAWLMFRLDGNLMWFAKEPILTMHWLDGRIEIKFEKIWIDLSVYGVVFTFPETKHTKICDPKLTNLCQSNWRPRHIRLMYTHSCSNETHHCFKHSMTFYWLMFSKSINVMQLEIDRKQKENLISIHSSEQIHLNLP